MPAESATASQQLERLTCDITGFTDLTGLRRTAIFKGIAAGRIPPGFTVGRKRLWAIDEIKAWIAAGAPSMNRWALRRGGR